MKKECLMFLCFTLMRFCCFFLGDNPEGVVIAQPSEYRMTQADYVDKYKDIAIKEMFENGIPASITLAQGMLESQSGNSPLAMYANNHFGIKCHSDWKGFTYIQDDDKKDECFRKYKTVEESFDDHSEFLKTRKRYSFLFDLRTTDYKGWAEGLHKAGYATDRRYASRLIKIIDDNKLYQYDRIQKNIVDRKERKIANREMIKSVTSEMVASRKVFLNNDIKYLVVQEGDTYYKIAHDMDLRLWQLHKYNESGENTHLQTGDKMYLQPKRRYSRTEQTHIVHKGETMYDISQLYGIKMRHLYKLNYMEEGEEPKEGQKIFLRHHT